MLRCPPARPVSQYPVICCPQLKAYRGTSSASHVEPLVRSVILAGCYPIDATLQRLVRLALQNHLSLICLQLKLALPRSRPRDLKSCLHARSPWPLLSILIHESCLTQGEKKGPMASIGPFSDSRKPFKQIFQSPGTRTPCRHSPPPPQSSGGSPHPKGA